MKIDFSAISSRYEEYSKLQKSSGEVLLNMLNIGENEDVLDLGCGVGNLTKKIRELTKGKVVGIDISEGMIEKARKEEGFKHVLLPFSGGRDSSYILHYISKELGLNEEKKYKLKIQGGKLAIRLLLDIELAKEFVLDLIQEYKQKEISEELIIKYIEIFFELYKNWRRKFKNSDKNILM